MKLRYTAEGGFAGLIRGVDIDTDALSPADARELSALIERARAAPPHPTQPGTRDAIEHIIEVQGAAPPGAAQWHLATSTVGGELAPLVAWLERRARPQRPR
jgi:hypothetical protein